MKTHLLKLFYPAVFSFMAFTANGQVTIGMNSDPARGALLDLKENDSEGANATKGLLYPRVALVNRGSLAPCADDTAEEMGQHVGLTVFNTVENCSINLCLGLYTWNGAFWESHHEQEIMVFTDPRDGNQYKYRQFGNAGTWMIENLRATTMNDGTPIETYPDDIDNIQLGTADYTTPKIFYPEKDHTIGDMGVLYNYMAAGNGEHTDNITETSRSTTSSTVQGICPDGWVLPSDYDWIQLEKEIAAHPWRYGLTGAVAQWDEDWEIGVDGYKQRGTHGNVMKSATSAHVEHNGTSNPLCCRGGGFNAIMAGAVIVEDTGPRAGYFTFYTPEGGVNYWTSTGNTSYSYDRALDYERVYLLRQAGSSCGLICVRCMKKDLPEQSNPTE